MDGFIQGVPTPGIVSIFITSAFVLWGQWGDTSASPAAWPIQLRYGRPMLRFVSGTYVAGAEKFRKIGGI